MRKSGVHFWDKSTGICVFASTVLFGLIAHGYCYFNLFYSHDSLIVYQWKEVEQLISIGRFVVPAFLGLRGDFYPPALVGLFSLVFLASALYITVRLLSIERKGLICLLCGVLTTSATVTLVNATYSKDADTDMLALLLAVASVYICYRFRGGLAAGAVLLCLSLGLYQAMFQAAVFLSMILVVRRILERADVKEILLTGCKAVASLLLGLVLYAVLLKIVLRFTGYELADSYNGLRGVGQFGDLSEILQLVQDTYQYLYDYFCEPVIVHSTWMAWLNWLLIGVTLVLLVYLAAVRGIRSVRLALLAAAVLLMPFGMNVVYFISKGVIHHLMIISFYFVYVLAAMVLEMFLRETSGWEAGKLRPLRRVLSYTVPCVLAVLILNSVIYANQVYLKKDLEYQSMLSTMTRIVDRIEQLEDYVPGETPVVFVGSLDKSGLFLPRDGLNGLQGTGLGPDLPLTYSTTYNWYFRQILSYPIHLLGIRDFPEVEASDEVADMPAFPAVGCCRMLEGVAVVKFSE